MVDAMKGGLGPLGRLDEHAAESDVLADVVLVLREMDATLRQLQDQVAGKFKPYYTVEEVAALTGRAPYTVRSWIREGRILAERLKGSGPKGRLLVSRSELEKLI